jgi:predicted flap endonuclease-1-like 5' DNA nuclease
VTKLEEIEGIGPTYAGELRAAGISSVDALLHAGATPRKREELEERIQVGHNRILDWVNRADLMRVRGVGEEYSDLLEQAGVDTVAELARRNPGNLHARLAEVNAARRLIRRMPSRGTVARWVGHARVLPQVVSYGEAKAKR